ncbi:MAG: hypothetical protein ACRCV7_04745 [Culicoidibacterales bacterium]
MKNTWKSIIGSVIGIIIIAFGVALIVKASIGIDPWGVFFNAMQTVYMSFKLDFMPAISFGDSITIISFFIVISASLIVKEKIKWLSIVGGIILGQFVNIWSLIFQIFYFPQMTVSIFGASIDMVSLFLLVVGILILSFGVAITIYYPAIMSPVDYLMYALDVKIKHISYGVIRVISDITMTSLGALIILLLTHDFGKTRVGIGTVLMFLVTGIIIDKVQKMLGNYILKISA